MYEPEYGRFMSVDPLWGKYESFQPYHYSLNQPISLLDNGGMCVEAMNMGAQLAIRASLPETYQNKIKCNDDGILNVESVKDLAKGHSDTCMGQSLNGVTGNMRIKTHVHFKYAENAV